ncbi:hypothetical protein F5884DRAFT_891498 [Xylogone sp. PMI_703]|nr:hypothetical protein F5884DRAFT_891498 [Xylogone sp. PMI_703]
MGFKTLFSRTRPPRVRQPKPVRPTSLGQLPLEIFLYITKFLPLDSQVALAVTCQTFYNAFKEKYLQAPSQLDDSIEYSFALLSENHMRNHIACFHCKSFHRVTESNAKTYMLLSRSKFERLPCMKSSHEKDKIDDYISWYFNPIIFRMIMKRKRQMRPYKELLDSLLAKEIIYCPNPFGLQWNSFSARVSNGRLLTRSHTITMPSLTNLNDWNMHICPHIFIGSPGGATRCSYYVRSVDSPGSARQPAPLHKGLIKCQFCRTEFRVDFNIARGVCLTMFVTTWKDLGQGKSHLDHDWQSHIDIEEQNVPPKVDFELGSICSAFERGSFKFNSVISPSEIKDMAGIYWAYSESGMDKHINKAWERFRSHYQRYRQYGCYKFQFV